MTGVERIRFLDSFNGDNERECHISSTDPAEQARIDEFLGGIGLDAETSEGWDIALIPMFSGGAPTQREFSKRARAFSEDPANKPFPLNPKTLICEMKDRASRR